MPNQRQTEVNKPEISCDRRRGQFYQDEKPISLVAARARWDAIDSDWTAGAYAFMCDLVLGDHDSEVRGNKPQ